MPKIIDLTLPMEPGMRGVEFRIQATVAKEGWNARTLQLYSHAGTHMDAQVHFDAGSGTIDVIPPDRCMGWAHVADVPGLVPKALIEISHLGPTADRVKPGDMLLLRTGWSRYAENPAIYRDGLPRISGELAGWCVERGVGLLGVEPPSVADVNNLREVTAIHQVLLGGDVIIVEGLTNLDRISRDRVYFMALPLKIAGGDGCPCRALAVETDREPWAE